MAQICLVGVLLTAFSACTAAPSVDTQRQELRHYLRQAERVWAPREATAASGITRLFRSQFVDPKVAEQVADKLLPLSERHLLEIRRLHPVSPKLAAIHRRYQESWEELRAGVRILARAMPADDARGLAEARKRLEHWREGMIVVARELRELMDELAVTMPEGEDQAGLSRTAPPAFRCDSERRSADLDKHFRGALSQLRRSAPHTGRSVAEGVPGVTRHFAVR